MGGELRENRKSPASNRAREGVARDVGRLAAISRGSRSRRGQSVDPIAPPCQELIAAKDSPSLGDFGSADEGREIAPRREISSLD